MSHPTPGRGRGLRRALSAAVVGTLALLAVRGDTQTAARGTRTATARRAPSPTPARPAPAAPAVALPAAGLESAPVTLIGGVPCVGTGDLARLLEATRFWRADLRKLVLRAGTHRLTLTADNPFVVLDERTLWLRDPVRSRGGELQAPVALLDFLPRDTTLARLIYEPRRGLVLKVPRAGLVRSPVLTAGDSLTRLVFPVEGPAAAGVAGRSRAHFRLRFAGAFAGALPETLPRAGLVRAIAVAGGTEGAVLEFAVSPAAQGFRLVRTPEAAGVRGSVALEFWSRHRGGLEDFAPEGRGGHGVRVIVIDPGHGGRDAGVRTEGVVEKDLALTLARLVRGELQRRMAVQIVLTREDDRTLTPEQRAELANRAGADLVLSLHFDAVPGTRRAGATAWCPPAEVGLREGTLARNAPIALLPWRDVALRHAVQSRAAAEAVLGSLARAGEGPTRLRERLLVPLLGVNAPGVVLDCATLTAPADRGRVTSPQGLRALAAAIAEGLVGWGMGE